MKTQEKLTDSAASASTASAQLGQVKEERAKIAKNLKETKGALQEVRGTLSAVMSPGEGGRATLSPGQGPGQADFDSLAARLNMAKERIDRVLEQVEAEE